MYVEGGGGYVEGRYVGGGYVVGGVCWMLDTLRGYLGGGGIERLGGGGIERTLAGGGG